MIFLLDVNFNQIIQMIEKRKTNAYRKVNEELILLYYEIGEYLFDLIEHSDYGDKIITNVVEFMHHHHLHKMVPNHNHVRKHQVPYH